MGFFRKTVSLIEVNFTVSKDKCDYGVGYHHPDLKKIEYSYLALHQLSKTLYTSQDCARGVEIVLKHISSFNDAILDQNIILQEELLEIIDTSDTKSMSFTSHFKFKVDMIRVLKTKVPVVMSQEKYLLSIPLAIKLALEQAEDFEKRFLIRALEYQSNCLSDSQFKDLNNVPLIPYKAYCHGLGYNV